jgi:glycosyltransferase involved in cell wall biosynthesis
MKITLVAQDPALDAAVRQQADPSNDTQLMKLSGSLAASGHKVTVYTRKLHASQPARVAAGGVRVIPLGPALADDDPLDGMSSYIDALRASWTKNRPDVVHAVRWDSGLAALAALRGLGIPLVQAFGSLGVAEQRHKLALGAAGAARIRLEPAIGRGATAVLAASSGEAADLAQLGVPRSSIRVIPCGVDTAEFAPEGPVAERNGRPRLLTVTDFTGQPELGTLLRALSRVPDAELIVAGGPPPAGLSSLAEYQALSRLAGSLGVADRVVFAGQVSRPEMPALLRSADLFVHTGMYEPTGIIPLQAMACGTPVATPASGATADAVVDGTTGILVQPGRPALLAQRIRHLLARPMLLEAYGVAATDRVRARYSWDRIARETLASYDYALTRSEAA